MIEEYNVIPIIFWIFMGAMLLALIVLAIYRICLSITRKRNRRRMDRYVKIKHRSIDPADDPYCRIDIRGDGEKKDANRF